jgi:Kef-type K+ transport system membrane component KefB
MQALSELGVLFLLFEMGLELSIDRLKVSRVSIAASADAEQLALSNC